MLNYIWAGLIIFSLVFALYYDGSDLYADRYRNAAPLPATVSVPGELVEGENVEATLTIAPAAYAGHYGVEAPPPQQYAVRLKRVGDAVEARFPSDAGFPEPLATVARETSANSTFIAEVRGLSPGVRGGSFDVALTFGAVRFVKIKAITAAAFAFAETAVELALGLIGVLALWLGLMRIAEVSGLINVFVRIVQPVLRPLFPQVPEGHPALGMIALNLAANMLGLGNAATPLGIKAMEELQTLNPTDDTATDPMVMLLAVNTASVQIIPPATLVAVMGLGVAEVFPPILIVTGISLIVAIVVTKLLGALPRFRATRPAVAGEGGR